MKPKSVMHSSQRELSRVVLSFLVDAGHPLVKLFKRINWALFEEQISGTYDDKIE